MYINGKILNKKFIVNNIMVIQLAKSYIIIRNSISNFKWFVNILVKFK